nr:aminoglycoside 6-adenylyltransferase [Paenibacillus alba]
MNGSRTNPNVPKDILQDYDIVYVIIETTSFLKDDKGINIFGDLIMIQEPYAMAIFGNKSRNFFTLLSLSGHGLQEIPKALADKKDCISCF